MQLGSCRRTPNSTASSWRPGRKLQSEPTVFSQSVGCPVQLGELLSPDGSMRMAKLDDLIDRVEVIKIDVEGMISTRCSQGGGLSTATVQ
jgi:hypothetical protein